MSTQTSQQHDAAHGLSSAQAEEVADADRRVSIAIVVLLSVLGVLFALVVPLTMYLLHRASGL